MARFTLRIVLHDATWDDYEELYEQMEAQGFTDTLTMKGGTVKMPPGEYDFVGEATKEQVLSKAKTAASHVVISCAVLVTESAGRTSYNLDEV